MTEASFLDVESIAIQLGSVVATLQMAIEGLPQDGQVVGEIPEVLGLCRDSLSERIYDLEKIAEGMKATKE